MSVYWLQQTGSDLPPDNGWLSERELACLRPLRFPKRRADWRLGRWTAKRALAALLHLSSSDLSGVSILAAPSGAPEVFSAGRPMDLALSISHSGGAALCAIAQPDAAIGCDLELIEPHSDAFAADYFTAEEQARVAQASDRALHLTLLWSAKESALKALHAGLRLDTRDLQVDFRAKTIPCASPAGDWSPFQVRSLAGGLFYGWWQVSGTQLRTLATATPSPAPVSLSCFPVCSAGRG